MFACAKKNHEKREKQDTWSSGRGLNPELRKPKAAALLLLAWLPFSCRSGLPHSTKQLNKPFFLL